MKYRALARKEPPASDKNRPTITDILKSFTSTDNMLAPSQSKKQTLKEEQSRISIGHPTKLIKRRSSSSNSSNTSPGQKQLEENLRLLDSVSINHPYHPIPEEILRFVPDSQLRLIEHIVKNPDKFIIKKKYVTNVDERSYLTVFEYQINDNWIIWDYDTGYVFFTGLWKTCGNNKTDIVKLIDKFPNISTENVRRVRGGFLKIQGTWLPFDIARDLCKRFCFNIRYCLIPLFGKEFPETCLRPTDENFGRLTDYTPFKRKRRASTNSNSRLGVAKPILSRSEKNRSHSDSMGRNETCLKLPLLEMEEILKASKQLHELSASPSRKRSFTTLRPDSFNYGGFTWSWRNEYDLKIVGRDHQQDDAVVDHDYGYSESLPGLPGIAVEGSDSSSIPKTFDGFDTLLRAAHQLTESSTEMFVLNESASSSVNTSPCKGKMDIEELLT